LSKAFGGGFLAAGVFWAQVAEWLMAADCKSATLRVTEVRILPCAPQDQGIGTREQGCAMNGDGMKMPNKGADSMPVERTGSDLERRFPVALGLYLVLAGLVWFTMGEGKVLVMGRVVETRLVPLIVIGGLALRTVLARQADRIRRSGEQGGGGTPGSL
jgi:hypothetical protein